MLPLRGLALAIALVTLLELPRDLEFWRIGWAQEPRLALGMSLKIACGLGAALGVARGWGVGFALSVVWCLQGSLMLVGQWLGQGPDPLILSALLARFLLLVLVIRMRLRHPS